MPTSFELLWESALAPFLEQARPASMLMVGSGRELAGAMLNLTASWGGKIHLAAPAPGAYADLISRDGDRFTLHRAPGQDVAAILPVPDIVLIQTYPDRRGPDSGVTEPPGANQVLPSEVGPSWGGQDWRLATGLLHALDRQARRVGLPYPVTLFAGLGARGVGRPAPSGQAAAPRHDDPRDSVLSALEDFVAAQAPRLVFSVVPLLDGFAVLLARDLSARHDVRGLLDTIAMGPAARLVAVQAEAGRIALEAALAALQSRLAAERYRNDKLHAALRQAQSVRRQVQNEPAPGQGRPKLPLRAAAGLRRAILARALPRRGSAAIDPALAASDITRLRESRIFDAAWYVRTYPDIEASGVDPAEHYYWHGAAEGRDPGPYFVTAYYLAPQEGLASQDGRASPTGAAPNPVLHYLSHGARARRDPSPDFDTGFYLDTNPDVAASGWNPLEHYLAAGLAEGRRALPAR